ncbi:MAG: sugar phosphate isomerase/epimerase [Albidovulum sp.]|nr:sugar phosphate isomerase/epimerase [Albidovulum sp.]MDE0306421.1 sugar phosphate isomerase/epimerase [Albidovulum sp.]MDE0532233.1 sugar phosphate isomerase/epimerase [Albidovulum sp.]
MQEYSYQLYSSRKFGPIGDTLQMVAEEGYSQVECFGDLIASELFSESLSGAGLAMPTAHVPLEAIESEPGKIVDLAGELGIAQIYAPYLKPEDRPNTVDGWSEFGQRLAVAGKPLRDAGIEFGWHNHDFEFVAIENGMMPIECMLDSDKRLLLEMDIAWVHVAGADPLSCLHRFSDRIGSVHIKDVAPPGENKDEDGWADVGHGTLDWNALHAAMGRTSAAYRIVEHDNPRNDRRFASRSMAALRTLKR